jgi:hypothetical protein
MTSVDLGPQALDKPMPASPTVTSRPKPCATLCLLDAAGRRRSPATMPRFHRGRPPCNSGSTRAWHSSNTSSTRRPFDTGGGKGVVAYVSAMHDELNADRVRSPKDLIAFLNRLREDIEQDAAEMKRREAAGEELARLSAHYASFTLPDALESLIGWLEDRFTDEQFEDLAAARDSAEAEKWREVARCFLMAAIYE